MAPVPIVVASAQRTPIGQYMGALSSLSAPDLGVVAAEAALKAAKVEGPEVDVVWFGQARQAGCGPNPARQVGWRVGTGEDCPAATINHACASGLRAMQLGVDDLRLGRAQIALVGGMESMSRLPHIIEGMRDGLRLGHREVVDLMYRDGFQCPISDMIMGETAELLAQEIGISREEQDCFALRSHEAASAAVQAESFADEIAPVTISSRRGGTVVDADEHIRSDPSLASLAKLRPVFDRDQGTVTAGNASGIADGAAAIVLMTEEEAERRGVDPLARWVDSEVRGCDPKRMGLGPVASTRDLLERAHVGHGDLDLIELNEAFAAQVLACLRELPFDPSLVNVLGGAIALGHPIGATGVRIVVTLLHELHRRDGHRALATLCVSGGFGMTALFERK